MASGPSKEEVVRQALAELGDAPAAELAAFVGRRFGLRIDPRFLPLYRATLRSRQELERARQARAVPGPGTGPGAAATPDP